METQNDSAAKIQFQSWNDHFKEMNGDAYSKLVLYKISIGEDHPEVKFMQFTNSVDKNDVKLFVDDIVKVKGTKKVGQYLTIIVNDGRGFRLKTNKTYINDYYLLKHMIEKVGNIYTHPELIKETI